jgi:hypothetical protein
MKNLICFLLLIFSLQFTTSTRNYNHFSRRELQAIISILTEDFSVNFDEEITSINPSEDIKDDNSEESTNYQIAVDPNDQVDIKLWNKLNAEDIPNMPVIKNYSDEATATRWLKWYVGISQRYSQVRLDKNIVSLLFIYYI